jgi:hypothetical protein
MEKTRYKESIRASNLADALPIALLSSAFVFAVSRPEIIIEPCKYYYEKNFVEKSTDRTFENEFS